MSAFELTLPVVKGAQAGREYYVSAIPLRHVPQIVCAAACEPAAADTAGRKRVRELVQYILGNATHYTLPPVVACIDGELEFRGGSGASANIGAVAVGMEARFAVNDGGYVIAAIAAAVAADPKIGNDTLSVVLIPDGGLKRSRQVFADLARNSIRDSASLKLLYDQRGEAAQLTKAVMRAVPVFARLTETKKSSISNRSTKLFTLSAIHSAMQTLLGGLALEDSKEKVKLGAEFWTEVARRIPAWQLAKERKVATVDLRRDFIHAHALALAAIARAGNQLLRRSLRSWKSRLKPLSTLDWSRTNTALWEGRAMNAGRLSKRSVNVILTGNLLKQHLGLSLSRDEEALEHEFQESRRKSRAQRI